MFRRQNDTITIVIRYMTHTLNSTNDFCVLYPCRMFTSGIAPTHKCCYQSRRDVCTWPLIMSHLDQVWNLNCRPGHVSVLTSSKKNALPCHESVLSYWMAGWVKTDASVTPACEMCSQKLSHILTSYITSSCSWLSAEPKHWQITLHPVLLKHINAEPWHVARIPLFIHHSSKSKHHLPFPLYSLIWLFYGGLNEAFLSLKAVIKSNAKL